VPEVRLGSPEVEPWVSERALGGDSGSGCEGLCVPKSPSHMVGLELLSLPVVESCLGELYVGRSAVEGSASGVEPTPLAVIPAEESGFPLSVVAPTSEDFIAFDAGDGSSQMSAPSFSVPFAKEFFGFLPVGSLSRDWEDFYSSLPTDCVGMFDAELIKEAFALPWEVDVPASPSCRDKEVSSSGAKINQEVRPSAPTRSLL
jgi:hypothetical protein